MDKTCTKCEIDQPLTMFSKRYDYPDRLLSWCKSCERERKTNAARRRMAVPSLRAAETLRQKLWVYGLTEAQHKSMVDNHGGRCGICDEAAPLHIDHSHVTGKVRGLLCFKCNVSLGHFRDSPHLLDKAAEYLCTSPNLTS